jgi:hypothetical protein
MFFHIGFLEVDIHYGAGQMNQIAVKPHMWIHWPFHGGILNTLPTLPPKKLALCRISRLFWFHKFTILDGLNVLHAT